MRSLVLAFTLWICSATIEINCSDINFSQGYLDSDGFNCVAPFHNTSLKEEEDLRSAHTITASEYEKLWNDRVDENSRTSQVTPPNFNEIKIANRYNTFTGNNCYPMDSNEMLNTFFLNNIFI